MSPAQAIAIDLGGTQVKAALVEGNQIQNRAAVQTDLSGDPNAILDQIGSLIDRVSDGRNKNAIVGIGFSSAGPIDTQAGIILGIPTIPGCEGFPIRQTIFDRFGLPVQIENDAIAATLGEWRHGAGRGFRNLVYITVSTGIGGGAVVDGRLLHGRQGMAAHVGHMRLASEGPLCSCGNSACFEAFASGTALAERAQSAARLPNSEFLLQALNAGDLNAKHVIEGARTGDKQCLALVVEEATYLGRGITSILHAFSPERVIIGGGLAHGFDLFEAGIHKVIETDAMAPFKSIRVVRSELGDDSGLAGAAAMVLEHSST
ncbi:MAG: ROK family protein [Rhizobiaceae bacterium]|nr:ROK family protein [Rhizobiaceae bacterium]